MNGSCFTNGYLKVWRESHVACHDDPNSLNISSKSMNHPRRSAHSRTSIGVTIRHIPWCFSPTRWSKPCASPRASRSTRGLRDVDSSKGAAFGQTFSNLLGGYGLDILLILEYIKVFYTREGCMQDVCEASNM